MAFVLDQNQVEPAKQAAVNPSREQLVRLAYWRNNPSRRQGRKPSPSCHGWSWSNVVGRLEFTEAVGVVTK